VEGTEHPALTAAAEQGLTHQHGHPQGEAEQQKHQQEGTAAVGGRHIGKLPDGAKADRRTGGGQHMTDTGRPLNLAHTTSGQDNIRYSMGSRTMRGNKKGRLVATFAMNIQTSCACKVTSLAS